MPDLLSEGIKIPPGEFILRVTQIMPGEPVQIKRWKFKHLNQPKTIKGPGINNFTINQIKKLGRSEIDFTTGRKMIYEIEKKPEPPEVRAEPESIKDKPPRNFWQRLHQWFTDRVGLH